MSANWQPIETAPKDGTWIDLWGVEPGTIGRRYPKVKWSNHAGYWASSRFIIKNAQFTHWMPLPDAPVTAREA